MTVQTHDQPALLDGISEQRRIEARYYANLSQVLAEVLKMGGLRREELQQRIRFSNPQLLRDLAGRGSHVAVVRAYDRNHLLLADQPFGLARAGLGIALMVSKHQLDLGPLQPGQAPTGRKRQIGDAFSAVVDDVGGQL